MEMEVIEKKENPFLKRTELLLMVDHKSKPTPKKEDLKKSIADQFKSIPEKVEIIYIFSKAGLTKSKIKARVWEEKIIEKKKKGTSKEGEVAEAKVEEKKEEVKEEEKPKEKPQEKPKEEKKEEKPKKEEKKPEEPKKVKRSET